MTVTVEVPDEASVHRLIKLLTDEIYSLTGQLVIATQTAAIRRGEPGAPSGSRRQRIDRALRAIPEQLDAAKATREALGRSLHRPA